MEKKGKEKTQATDFYLYEKLHDQPNSWMTSAEFWAMAEAHICLRGNFYAYKMGIEGRPIQELIPLKADVVTKVEQNEDRSLTYHVKMRDGHIEPVPGNRFMHLRGLTLDGITGINPIEYARETIGLGVASNQFLGKYFGKGLHPGAIVKHPLQLSAPAHANLKKDFLKKYEGLGKAWEVMLLDEGMDVTFPQIKLVDAQYLEQMKMNDAQICGLFRVPAMLIQSAERVETNASAEQFAINFVVHSVVPDCVNYEKAIRRDLLTPAERKKYYAKFNVDGLLRGDFKNRMDAFAMGIDKEIFCPNEVRELLDMNPYYPGGDEYRTRTSSMKEIPEKSEKVDK
jgi:HK97 family phage portal protein